MSVLQKLIEQTANQNELLLRDFARYHPQILVFWNCTSKGTSTSTVQIQVQVRPYAA